MTRSDDVGCRMIYLAQMAWISQTVSQSSRGGLRSSWFVLPTYVFRDCDSHRLWFSLGRCVFVCSESFKGSVVVGYDDSLCPYEASWHMSEKNRGTPRIRDVPPLWIFAGSNRMPYSTPRHHPRQHRLPGYRRSLHPRSPCRPSHHPAAPRSCGRAVLPWGDPGCRG